MKKIYITLLCLTIITCSHANEKLDGKYNGSLDYKEYIYFYNNNYYYKINLCEGFGFIKGRYEIKSNKIVCHIDEKRISGSKDDKKTQFNLILNSSNAITFETLIGCDLSHKTFKKTDIKKLKVTINNLRLREYADQNSNIIQILNKNDILIVLVDAKDIVIDGIKGKWLFVKTEKNNFGYCFSGYLE